MAPTRRLTNREREVIDALLAGNTTTAALSEALAVERRTVVTHLYNIRRKLGMRNTAELILHAVRNGWVKDE